MNPLNFTQERISFTPAILYIDYINLQNKKFLQENFKDITPRDFSYLVNIFYHQNISQKQLSELLFVSEANVAQIIKRLEKNKFIHRIPDESNKSKKIIYLTEKGKDMVFLLMKIIYEWEAEFFKRYSDEEVELFKKMLYEYSQKSINP